MLLIIILVCAILSAFRENFEADTNSYKCKDVILAMLKKQGKSAAAAESEINSIFEVSPPEYANIMGVDWDKLPADLKKRLPKINLSQTLLQLKRDVLLDEKGEHVPLDKCVVTIDHLKNLYTENPKQVSVENGSIYDAITSETKVCTIGSSPSIKLQSNIKNGLTNSIEALAKLDPSGDRLVTYGCQIDFTSIPAMRDTLIKLYQLSNAEEMSNIRKLLSEYNITFGQWQEAIQNNNKSRLIKDKAKALREAAEVDASMKQTLANEQIKATAKSLNDRTRAQVELESIKRFGLGGTVPF